MSERAKVETLSAGEYWHTHYNSMAHHESLDFFVAEACDYVDRLTRLVRLEGTERLLDFGCGLGLVAGLLGGSVGELHYWDYSKNMLDTASENLVGMTNVREADLSTVNECGDECYDVVIVNSVIQYMSREDLSNWMRRWRQMLEPNGRLVVSDVILPDPAFLTEVMDSIRFSARKGFLIRTLVRNFAQYARYLLVRSSAPMSRYSKNEFSKIAEDAGMLFRLLPENLTYRSNRFSAVLQSAPD